MPRTQKSTTEEFIKKTKKIHNDRYDYSLVKYINAHTKVKIICSTHGIFEQEPQNHLKGQNCPICYGNKKITNEQFIRESSIVHNNKYDYSLVNYINANSVVKIICKEHGIFEQKPDNHLRKKQICPICNHKNNGDRCRKTNEEFIDVAIKNHGYKYDYSLIDYKNAYTKVKIVCHKHGVFYQSPKHHLYGSGCPKCNQSKGEITIEKYLIKNNIKYTEQKTFDDCKYKKLLLFDFYLYQYNICIEFDGEQHFNPRKHFGGIKSLELQQKRDSIKNQYCKDNNIKLLRIKYNENIEKSIKQEIE